MTSILFATKPVPFFDISFFVYPMDYGFENPPIRFQIR